MSSIPEQVAHVLAENGASEPGSSHHGWRCEYPDRYGPCTCTADLVAELVEVTERLVREQVAAEVRAEVEGYDRGGTYARQKYATFNRLAARIARGGST